MCSTSAGRRNVPARVTFSGVRCVIVAGMSNQRTHYVTTTDGVTIGGTVHGQGPPLVFVQGVIGDGDLDWQVLVGHLSGRFTCYLPSYRGRGLSGDHPDLGFGRRVDDVLAYVDSIGEPTGLVGWSGGGSLALAAAGAQPGAVDAVAPFEPGMFNLLEEHEQAALGATVARTAALAAGGRLTEASRAFATWPFDDEEIAAAEDVGYFEAAGRYVPNLLNILQQDMGEGSLALEDPAVLGALSGPVLLLLGSESMRFFAASARYVADHVPDARIQEIPGAGHAAPLTHPEALAEALTEFFSQTLQPA